jgi:autocrine motility factor receptor
LIFSLSNCLRAWLEQDTSCPTCRLSLQDEADNNIRRNGQMQLLNQIMQPQQVNQDQQQQQQAPQPQQQQQNIFGLRRRNFFHFDGTRYFSWLPSFSVEVTHNLGNTINLPFLRQTIDENRLNAMSQQVLQVFPHVSLATILEDLRQTHSAELTIDNILQERLNLANNVNRFESNRSR